MKRRKQIAWAAKARDGKYLACPKNSYRNLLFSDIPVDLWKTRVVVVKNGWAKFDNWGCNASYLATHFELIKKQ